MPDILEKPALQGIAAAVAEKLGGAQPLVETAAGLGGLLDEEGLRDFFRVTEFLATTRPADGALAAQARPFRARPAAGPRGARGGAHAAAGDGPLPLDRRRGGAPEAARSRGLPRPGQGVAAGGRDDRRHRPGRRAAVPRREPAGARGDRARTVPRVGRLRRADRPALLEVRARVLQVEPRGLPADRRRRPRALGPAGAAPAREQPATEGARRAQHARHRGGGREVEDDRPSAPVLQDRPADPGPALDERPRGVGDARAGGLQGAQGPGDRVLLPPDRLEPQRRGRAGQGTGAQGRPRCAALLRGGAGRQEADAALLLDLLQEPSGAEPVLLGDRRRADLPAVADRVLRRRRTELHDLQVDPDARAGPPAVRLVRGRRGAARERLRGREPQPRAEDLRIPRGRARRPPPRARPTRAWRRTGARCCRRTSPSAAATSAPSLFEALSLGLPEAEVDAADPAGSALAGQLQRGAGRGRPSRLHRPGGARDRGARRRRHRRRGARPAGGGAGLVRPPLLPRHHRLRPRRGRARRDRPAGRRDGRAPGLEEARSAPGDGRRRGALDRGDRDHRLGGTALAGRGRRPAGGALRAGPGRDRRDGGREAAAPVGLLRRVGPGPRRLPQGLVPGAGDGHGPRLPPPSTRRRSTRTTGWSAC